MKLKAQHKDYTKEAEFSASKSSGPGGQNVNKVNSKVELRLNIEHSRLLTKEEKAILFLKLANKINKDGELIVVSQTERSQLGNKEKASEKLNALIVQALKTDKKRIATKTPRFVKENRLKDKKNKAVIKLLRKPPEL